jgi:hypothetical protein
MRVARPIGHDARNAQFAVRYIVHAIRPRFARNKNYDHLMHSVRIEARLSFHFRKSFAQLTARDFDYFLVLGISSETIDDVQSNVSENHCSGVVPCALYVDNAGTHDRSGPISHILHRRMQRVGRRPRQTAVGWDFVGREIARADRRCYREDCDQNEYRAVHCRFTHANAIRRATPM